MQTAWQSWRQKADRVLGTSRVRVFIPFVAVVVYYGIAWSHLVSWNSTGKTASNLIAQKPFKAIIKRTCGPELALGFGLGLGLDFNSTQLLTWLALLIGCLLR